MKHLKKLGSVLLALVMVLALAVPVFATQEVDSEKGGNGSITVSNATVDKDYTVYKIFDATYMPDGKAAYKIDSTSPWYTAVSTATNLFTLRAIADTNTTYDVAVAEGITAEAISTWIAGVSPKPAYTATTTATETEIKFTGLEEGYYWVESSLGATVTLTNASPDVTVIDKNQVPNKLTKDADTDTEDNSVQIGDVLDYSITYTATNYVQANKIVRYVFTDTMSEGLELVADSVKITVTGPGEGATPVDVTNTNAIFATPGESDKYAFKVTIPWVTPYDDSRFNAADNTAYAKELDANSTSLYQSPSTITLSYKVKVTEAAADLIEKDLKNDVTVVYDSVNGGGSGKPGDDTKSETVYTYALAIKKVDTKGNALEGATFTLADAEGNAVNVTGDDGVYVVDPESTSNVVVSPKDGVIVIKGVSNQGYKLTETKAPEGYNLLAESVTVTPTMTSMEKTDTTIYFDKDGNPTEEVTDTTTTIFVEDIPATAYAVVNRTGQELPSTGGIGTTIFYIVGGILVVGAVVLLITKRRTSVDDE